jgi:hypothetical protein
VGKPTERSTITAVLRRIDLKVRFNQGLYHLAVAACLVLGTLVLIELAPLLVPVSVPPDSLIIVMGSAAFLMFLVWSQFGGGRLARAAGVADTRAGLQDELKSAYWFMRRDDASPWVALQVGRAAATAGRLDVRRLVPIAVPGRFLGVALGLFVVLQLLAFVPSDGPLLTFTAVSDSVQAERAREAYVEEIRDLIDGEGEELLDEDALAFLEDALEELQAEETSIDELLRDLRDAEDALEEGNLEMAAMRDALEELVDDLSGSPELAEFIEALGDLDLSEAADLLRELSERLSGLDLPELANLQERLQQAAQLDAPVIEDLLAALQEAAEALSEDRLADAQEAMEQIAQALQELADRQSRQQSNNEAAERAEALQDALAQEQLGSDGESAAQSAQARSVAGQEMDASMAQPSSSVSRSEGSPREGSQSGPAGNATGDPGDGDLELGAATTLEAALALEIIEGNTPDQDEPALDPEDLFQEASRQQSSIVQYRDVQAPSQYSQGSALNAERIPWRYRSLVRKYFLAIRPAPHRAPGRYSFDQTGPDERK